jgi:MFS family permease
LSVRDRPTASNGETVETSQPEPALTSLIAVGGILCLTQLGYYLTAAALPLYLRDLGAAQGRVGLEVGLGNLASLAATLFVGPAINRFGPRPALRAGAAFFLAAAVGMLAVEREFSVSAFRALQGVGNAVVVPGAYTLGAALLPRRQGMAVGTVGMLNALSLAVGPALGLALYTSHGPVWLFLPAAFAAGLGLLLTGLLPQAGATGEPAPGFGFERSWLPWLFANALTSMYFGGVLAYLPLVLQRVHGPNAGIFFTADALGVLLLRIPTGVLVDRAGPRIPVLAGLALTLPGIAALALPPSIWTVAAAGACTGAGAGLTVTGITADLSSSSSSANRGTAMSLGSASFMAGVFVGSAVSGLLIGPGGFNAVLLFGGVATALAAPLVLLPSAQRRRRV